MKICKKCKGRPQPLENFYKSKLNKDGHHGSCKLCMNKVTLAWYNAHPEVAKDKYERRGHAPRRKGTLRREHRKHLGEKCRRCEFVPEDVCQLTVDHIDRNHKNNDPVNLQTLCANCHNLKSKVELTAPEKLLFLNLVPGTS